MASPLTSTDSLTASAVTFSTNNRIPAFNERNTESQNEAESLSDGERQAGSVLERQEALESSEHLAVDSYIPVQFADFE